MNKQDVAKMMISIELEANIAKLISMRGRLDPNSDYAKHIDKMIKQLERDTALLAMLD